MHAITDGLLAGAAFPDVTATYRDLGLVVTGDRVSLVAAPHAAIRDAIMAAPVAPVGGAGSGGPPAGR